MSAKRICKVCRAELLTQVCKFCGFKEKTIRIGDSQEGFTKISHLNRVYRNQRKTGMPEGTSSESRLKLYLRQYSKMLKEAAARLSEKLNFPNEQADRFGKEVFSIWKMFLLKRQQEGFSQAGMFKKYFIIAQKREGKEEGQKEEGQKEESNKEEANQKFKEQKEQNSNEDNQDDHKRSNPVPHPKQPALRGKSLTSISKFRSFYTITLKPQLKESIEQRKSDDSVLTSIQKGFLSYLLAVNQYDLPLLKFASQKYLKMLLKIRDKTVKSYIKYKQIDHELEVRNLQQPYRKEELAYSILLFDILTCFTQQTDCSLGTLLRHYSSGPPNSFIDHLTGMISEDQKPQNANLPQLSFELVYSILFLAANRSGCCTSPSEIISACGILQLRVSEIDGGLIKNEENISTVKMRKNTHLLASFLSLKPRLNIPAWTKRSTELFGISGAASKVMIILEVLMREVMQRTVKQFQGDWLSGQRSYKYYRHPQLQQDIAVTAAILLFIKMSTGLTSYPYLLQFPLQLEALGTKASTIGKLKKQGELLVSGSSLNTRFYLPSQYKQQIDTVQISKIAHSIQGKDPLFSLSAFNRAGVRLRNLNHLSNTTSEELKKNLAPHLKSDVLVRYQQASLQQLLLALNEQNKRLRGQRAKVPAINNERQLSSNVSRQLQVIMSPEESIAKDTKVDRSQQCQVDKPCSNYQFLLDYGQQNLKLSGRLQLLHFMQLFCLNAISYSQLSQWLLRFEGLLKSFEM